MRRGDTTVATRNHSSLQGVHTIQKLVGSFRSEWKQLEENCEDLLKRLSVNNLKSGNFGSLIDVFLARQAELAPSLETDEYGSLHDHMHCKEPPAPLSLQLPLRLADLQRLVCDSSLCQVLCREDQGGGRAETVRSSVRCIRATGRIHRSQQAIRAPHGCADGNYRPHPFQVRVLRKNL